MMLAANDSTEFSSDTDDTHCVISSNAKFIIWSQFVPRVDSLSEYWKVLEVDTVLLYFYRFGWCPQISC